MSYFTAGLTITEALQEMVSSIDCDRLNYIVLYNLSASNSLVQSLAIVNKCCSFTFGLTTAILYMML